jgi:hypothetical protein
MRRCFAARQFTPMFDHQDLPENDTKRNPRAGISDPIRSMPRNVYTHHSRLGWAGAMILQCMKPCCCCDLTGLHVTHTIGGPR